MQTQGLLTTHKEEWWDFRRKVQQPMLKPRSTQGYTPLLDGIAQSFIDELVRPRLDPQTRETPDNFMDDLFRWALESVGLLALNTRLGCLDINLPPDSEQFRIIESVNNIFAKSQVLDAGLHMWKRFPKLSPSFQSFSNDVDLFAHVSKKHIRESLRHAFQSQLTSNLPQPNRQHILK